MDKTSTSDSGQPAVPPNLWLVSRSLAYLESKALYIASKFQFADHLKDGPLSAAEIASRAGTDPTTTDRFLKYLAVKGVFHRVSEGVYENTPTAEYLRSDHPQTVRLLLMHFDFTARATAGFAEATRNPLIAPYQAAFGTALSVWDYLAQDPEEQTYFDQGMESWTSLEIAMLLDQYDWAKYGNALIVDVGGGIGHLTAALQRKYPFTGVIFDYKVNGAEYWRQHFSDVVSRTTFVQGSFFESVTNGGDVYILKHIVHDWPDPESVRILSTVAAAMQETQRTDPSKHPVALIVEIVYDFPPDNPIVAELDMQMLLIGGKERSIAEFRELCRKAGLRVKEVVQIPRGLSVIEVELSS